MANNLAYIDFVKCRLCRKCAPVCPTNAIVEINFPPRKEKETAESPGKGGDEPVVAEPGPVVAPAVKSVEKE